MKTSGLNAVALGVGAATVAGFGASLGRDLYKSTKKSAGTLILITALVASISLPFLGCRNLVRGRGPGEWWKRILDLVQIPVGIGIAVALASVAGLILGVETLAPALLMLLTASAGAMLFGLLVGGFQRPSTQRRFAIARLNDDFLSQCGIRETGESEITHVDQDGNALRLLERSEHALVFMAVGRKNKRAYIQLSKEGQMLSYSGIVALGATRNLGQAA